MACGCGEIQVRRTNLTSFMIYPDTVVMAKSKPSRASEADATKQEVKSLSTVKDGGVTKSSTDHKAKSKQIAQQAAKAHEANKIKQASDSDASESEDDSDESDDFGSGSGSESDDEDEIEKPATANGVKVNGSSKDKITNGHDTSDSSASSDESSDADSGSDSEAPAGHDNKAAQKGQSKIANSKGPAPAKGAKKDDSEDEDSDDSSESESEEEEKAVEKTTAAPIKIGKGAEKAAAVGYLAMLLRSRCADSSRILPTPNLTAKAAWSPRMQTRTPPKRANKKRLLRNAKQRLRTSLSRRSPRSMMWTRRPSAICSWDVSRSTSTMNGFAESLRASVK